MKNFPQLDAALKQKKISPSAYKNILLWLNDKKYSDFVNEIKSLIQENGWEELNNRFFQELPFGTAGRRGHVGIGPNRINKITIGNVAQGLVNYFKGQPDAKNKGFVISFDTRLTSKIFADYVASIFSANGFFVYIFDNPRPTAELSFAINYLSVQAGVMISASHNPPTDNGIKIYLKDGAVMPNESSKIMEFAKNVKEILKIDFLREEENKKIKIIGEEIDDAYLKAVIAESLETKQRSARIVYSPLHGTGIRNVFPVLQRAGFKDIHLVAEQIDPDGNFPTVKNGRPDPQKEEAAELTIKKCAEVNADIGIFSDPDADRLGAVVRDKNGKYIFLDGDQIASILGFYVLENLKRKNKLNPEKFIVKTMPTTEMLADLANQFKIKIYGDFLIGYKYLIHKAKEVGFENFIFSAEETNGFLKGTYTKDKDAAIPALLLCEYASILKNQSKNLIDKLNELYKKFGLYWGINYSIPFDSAIGNEKLTNLMKNLRQEKPKDFLGEKVTEIEDCFDKSNPLDSNVLVFYLSTDKKNKLILRPSGTEPFLRFYTNFYKPFNPNISDEDIEKEREKMKQHSQEMLGKMKKYLNTFTQ